MSSQLFFRDSISIFWYDASIKARTAILRFASDAISSSCALQDAEAVLTATKGRETWIESELHLRRFGLHIRLKSQVCMGEYDGSQRQSRSHRHVRKTHRVEGAASNFSGG